jgi:hypothetical protein
VVEEIIVACVEFEYLWVGWGEHGLRVSWVWGRLRAW